MHLTSRQLESLAQDVDDLHNEGMKTFAEETADLHLDALRASRRRLVARTGIVGATALAVPLLLPRGLSARVAAQGLDDQTIAGYAQSVELAAVAAYTAAAPALTSATLPVAQLFLGHHQAHADAFGAVAGDKAATGPNAALVAAVTPALEAITDETGALEFAFVLENQAAFTYAAALTLLTFVNLLATLLASRMAFDVYGSTDKIAVGIFYGAMVLAYILGGFSNFFLRRPFVSDAVFGLVAMLSLAFVVINFFNKEGESQKFASGVDWRLVPAAILILFALWILAGLAIACSTRYELIPTLSICSALFLLGLISDYLFGRAADAGSWWAAALYAVVPNWQLFWLADALENQKSIPWSYVGKSFGYVVGYLGAVLAIALFMFEDRELT
jgi:hypothetical protein